MTGNLPVGQFWVFSLKGPHWSLGTIYVFAFEEYEEK